MKLTPYLVAANFGADLYVNAVISTDPTNACVVVVDEFRRQLPPDTPPLTRIIWCELAEEFLVKALAGMRGELLPSGEQTKVVALRPVEAPAQPERPRKYHSWYKSPLDDVFHCQECGISANLRPDNDPTCPGGPPSAA